MNVPEVREVIHTRVTGHITMNVHVLKITFVIFEILVGYKVLYFPQENDILYQPCLEIFVGYEVLYFPQENDILHQPRLVCESL